MKRTFWSIVRDTLPAACAGAEWGLGLDISHLMWQAKR